MLNNSGPRGFTIRIIDRSISLKIRSIQHFGIKTDGTVLQCTKFIIKICINGARIYHFLCQLIQLILIFKIICIEANFNPIKHICNHLCISANRNSLIQCIKIIVIKCQPNRKPLDDKGRKIFAITSPLFLGISLDQFFIDIFANQRNCLFLQILWLCDTGFFPLLLNLCSCFLWRNHIPHLVKRIHVKWQRVQFSLVICHWRICKTVKLRKLCHILPYFFVVCMENMCPILMYMNFLYVLRIHISRNIRSLVNDKNPLSCVCCLSGKDSSK